MSDQNIATAEKIIDRERETANGSINSETINSETKVESASTDQPSETTTSEANNESVSTEQPSEATTSEANNESVSTEQPSEATTSEATIESGAEPSADEQSSGNEADSSESPAQAPPEASPGDQPKEASSEKKSTSKRRRRRKKNRSGGQDDTPSILDLQKGQHLVGKVKNITDFGAFVDLGIAQDGLVHISQLSKHKVDKPGDVVSEGQEVEVWVKKVDKKRGRISLSMIRPVSLRLRDIEEGAELEGTITRLESYGAFVDIGSERDGLVHISEITHEYIENPQDVLAVGDKVKVKVLKVDRKKRQVDLSIKALLPPPPPKEEPKPIQPERRPMERPKSEAVEISEDGPMITAMAAAFSAFQEETTEEEEPKKQPAGTSKEKQKEELEAIISRTLESS